MLLDLRPEARAQRPREILDQIPQQIGIIRQLGRQQLVVQRHLGVGDQHRHLGPVQPLAHLPALRQRVVVGQHFQLAVQPAARLEPADEAGLAVQELTRIGLGQRDRLHLQDVVAQHQRRDLVGHGREQLVALLLGHVAVADHGIEQDLDVDLVIRAVDPGRVVDEVGVDVPALLGERDPALLREAEIAALGDDAAAQLLGVDPDRVVGPIERLGMTLRGGLDIGADAAVPEQVDGREQDRADQLVRGELLGVDGERLARLRRQPDRLDAARVDRAACAQLAAVVVVPAGARQREQALPARRS